MLGELLIARSVACERRHGRVAANKSEGSDGREEESQWIGHKGETLKSIGIRSRAEIEKLLGAKCFLGLHVKVSKDWQRDPKSLERLGYLDN